MGVCSLGHFGLFCALIFMLFVLMVCVLCYVYLFWCANPNISVQLYKIQISDIHSLICSQIFHWGTTLGNFFLVILSF